jgi:hypothetical protein
VRELPERPEGVSERIDLGPSPEGDHHGPADDDGSRNRRQHTRELTPWRAVGIVFAVGQPPAPEPQHGNVAVQDDAGHPDSRGQTDGEPGQQHLAPAEAPHPIAGPQRHPGGESEQAGEGEVLRVGEEVAVEAGRRRQEEGGEKARPRPPDAVADPPGGHDAEQAEERVGEVSRVEGAERQQRDRRLGAQLGEAP